MKDKLTQYYENNLPRFLAEWGEFLRFPSISMEPDHDTDCRECARWLASHLAALGFKAEVRETDGKPVVFALRPGELVGPSVLYYGHYDVQPVDPLELWHSKPFDAVLRGERLYGRGAVDNKGQTFYVLKAIEALIRTGTKLPTLKIIIEGEEESGSGGIEGKLESWREDLQASVLLVCDTETLGPGRPAISMGLRGIVHLSVRLGGISHDLHSGIHGGVAPNPATQLARMIATLHNPDGSIAVAGFYDSVTPIGAKARALALSYPFDPVRYEHETGVKPLGGEIALSPQERVGLRPTIEVNGLNSGYRGPGVKTIIPAFAEAKITSRIVTGQNPQRILSLLKEHLLQCPAAGLELTFPYEGAGEPAISLDPESTVVARAHRVLCDLGGAPPVYAWWGASIPIVSKLAMVAGAEPLLVGFGLPADAMHAPNESFALPQFRDGFLFAGLFFSSFAETV